MHRNSAFIGIGSNLNDPLQQVTSALRELASLTHCKLVAHSPWYRSHPLGPTDQPDYINGAARLDTSLDPLSLLHALQIIEQSHHRVRRQRWGPRTLDLDILLYGNRVIDTPHLTIPHPELSRRNFVLYPLADLEDDIRLPNGVSIRSLLARSSGAGLERLGNKPDTDKCADGPKCIEDH